MECSASDTQPIGPDDRPWWVAMRGIVGVGPVRTQRLLHHFGTLRTAWEAEPLALRRLIEDRSVQHIVAERQRQNPVEEFQRLVEEGVTILTLTDEGYPELLRQIPSPPPVLFLRGTVVESDRRAVAIVGTRRATAYGRDMARCFARDLASAGVTIVSGLALGVDGVAHLAALDAGGRTIAFMGSGVRRIYPASHKALAQRITGQGALISDFLPDAPPDAPNFPSRNRLISGMSLAVLVIEAPNRSGALITVDFAADQGRDVFAVPGPVTAANSAGCNRLLRDGARVARDAQDVLDDLGLGSRPIQASLPHPATLDEPSRRTLSLLTGEPRHIDDIAAATDMDIGTLSAVLMTLELDGLARNVGANYYSRST